MIVIVGVTARFGRKARHGMNPCEKIDIKSRNGKEFSEKEKNVLFPGGTSGNRVQKI